MAKHPQDMSNNHNNPIHLGEFSPLYYRFADEGNIIDQLSKKEFEELAYQKRFEKINQLLLEAIQNTPSPCFLLPAITLLLEKINEKKIFDGYSLNQFELWLNQFTNLSFEENLLIRSKIIGKKVPREEYQVLFPIGMGKVHSGSHFVTAHGSPDLDTTVASFWGWIDAFGARVSEGLHIWNVPGGPPESSAEINVLFHHVFGKSIFSYVAKNRTSLSVSGIEMMTQKGLVRKSAEESCLSLDLEKNQHAVVLVDKDGFYQGDWRNIDVEGVRQVIMLVNQCLRWFESNFTQELITLFSREDLSSRDLPIFIRSVLDLRMADAEPAKDFSETQRKLVHDYLNKVLFVAKGLNGTFGELALAVQNLELKDFHQFVTLLGAIQISEIFDSSGNLIGKREQLFKLIEKVLKGLDKAIHSVRDYVDKLEVALKVKSQVFSSKPLFVSYRDDIEEIRSKIGNNPYLTVTVADDRGNLIPMGIVHASDIYKPVVGTVTLRDFCNREETKVPSYLEVISVVDHHKVQLQTLSPATVTISDVQSSNVLTASLAFAINDRYSTAGMSEESIHKQREEIYKDLSSASSKRILKRLLTKEEALQKRGKSFVDPAREFLEYLHFLYAILDDTDLLTKVTRKDVECVAELLNRLKTLMLKKEVEVINFDDLSEGKDFVATAARRLLRNPDLYSLYKKVYQFKEEIIQENIKLCADGKPSFIFADTKEQNGCCRVGQTKIFPGNYAFFIQNKAAIQSKWLKDASDYYKSKKEVDLHMHMISTLAGVDNLYNGASTPLDHKDEMWIWMPENQEQAIEHLKGFLNAFKAAPHVVSNKLNIRFLGKNAKLYARVFEESFLVINQDKIVVDQENPLSMAIISYEAGSMNSRKAMISPYLPRLVV